jgi:hypothetical protein
VANLEQVRAHLLVSWALWQAGNREQACAHAAHPAAELLSVIKPALGAGAPASAFESALQSYSTACTQGVDWAQAQTLYQQALAATDTARQVVVADAAWANPTLRAEVVRSLLHSAEQEYEESFQNGKIAPGPEYQDAHGFITVAAEVYNSIPAATRSQHPAEDQTILAALQQLQTAVASMQPPDPVVLDPAGFEKQIDTASAELAEAYGLAAEAVVDAGDQIQAIRGQLQAAQEKLTAGDQEAAYEAAASAYLDGFEQLEPELVQKDKELMEKLEVQFKDLRDAIKSGQSAEALGTMITAINANLDIVQDVLDK